MDISGSLVRLKTTLVTVPVKFSVKVMKELSVNSNLRSWIKETSLPNISKTVVCGTAMMISQIDRCG